VSVLLPVSLSSESVCNDRSKFNVSYMLWMFDWVRREPWIIILTGIHTNDNIPDPHAFILRSLNFTVFRHSYRRKKNLM
jgi:hypothetical protein